MNVREELKAYYDNELSPAQAEEVRQALLNDPEAAREFEEIAALSQVLRTEAVQPEVRWKEATLAKLEKRRKPNVGTPLVWLAGSCATVLACMVLFPVFAQSKSAAKEAAYRSQMKSVATGAAVAKSMPMESAGADSFVTARTDRPVDGNLAMKERQQQSFSSGEVMDADAIRGYRTAPARVPGSAAAGEAADSTALVIKNANLALEVKSVAETQLAAESMVRSFRGMIQNANKQVIPDGPTTMSMTVRVPANRFEVTMQGLRKLGKVLSESMNGEDVTAQVADVDARLKTLRAEESQFQLLLGKAKSIGQVIQVRDKISEVRQEIESLDAQQRTLRNQAKMSSIELSLQERPKEQPKEPTMRKTSWSEDAWSGATESLRGLGRFLGTVGINLLVFSPVWLTLGLVGWLVARRR